MPLLAYCRSTYTHFYIHGELVLRGLDLYILGTALCLPSLDFRWNCRAVQGCRLSTGVAERLSHAKLRRCVALVQAVKHADT